MSRNSPPERSRSHGFRGLVLASVPEHDRELTKSLFHDAVIQSAPPSMALHPDTKALAVTIHDAVSEAELDRMPALEAIITRSDGYDHLPLDLCRRRGIAVYHLGDYASQSVAQLSLAMLLALARRLPEATATTQAARWDRDALVGSDLTDRVVGVLGTGSIGGAVVRLLDGIGVPTVTCDIDPEMQPKGLAHSRAAPLDEMLDASDALTIHVPLTPETSSMIGADEIARLGSGALIVNTARGDVIDHDALLDALDAGAVAGFAADVLPGEPDPPLLPALAAHPKTLITPHLGAHNASTIRRRYERTAHIADAVLDGRQDEVAGYRVDNA